MLEVRLCKNEAERAEGIGKVFEIDAPEKGICKWLTEKYGEEFADAVATYGYRVNLQKDVAESKDWSGRSWQAVETHLKSKGIPHTIVEWEKGKTAETSLDATKETMSLATGVPVEDITDEQAVEFRKKLSERRKARLAANKK